MDASKLKTWPKLYWFHWSVKHMRLEMKSKREIFETRYRRCQQAGKKDKGKILDEVAGTTGLNRDHLAHVPASYGKKRAGQAGSPACPSEARPGRRGLPRGHRYRRKPTLTARRRGRETSRLTRWCAAALGLPGGFARCRPEPAPIPGGWRSVPR
jgi:hypothetical protein